MGHETLVHWAGRPLSSPLRIEGAWYVRAALRLQLRFHPRARAPCLLWTRLLPPRGRLSRECFGRASSRCPGSVTFVLFTRVRSLVGPGSLATFRRAT